MINDFEVSLACDFGVSGLVNDSEVNDFEVNELVNGFVTRLGLGN